VVEILYTPVIVIHVAACLFLILVVLLQPGKSGGLGAFTGAGATQVFGGRGAGNILTRATWITAATFFLTSVVLAFLSTSGDKSLEERGEKIGVIKEEEPTRAPQPAAPEATDEPAPPEPEGSGGPLDDEAAPPAEPAEEPAPAEPGPAGPAAPVAPAKPAPPPAPVAPAAPPAPPPAAPPAPRPATPTPPPAAPVPAPASPTPAENPYGP